MIADHSLNTVRLDTAEVSLEKNVGDLLALLLAEAVALEGFYAKLANLVIINMMILHFSSPVKKYLYTPI
jgi:hypothetical protein